MKKLYLLLFLPFLLAASCKKKDDDQQPVDKLPPATMTGANTFGCLVNGEVWLPHTESILDLSIYAYHYWGGGGGPDRLLVSAKKIFNEPDIYQELSINLWYPVLGENQIPFSKRYLDLRGCGDYVLDTLSPRSVFITKLDTINFIASGTFEFTVINESCHDTIRISQGRFDVDSHL